MEVVLEELFLSFLNLNFRKGYGPDPHLVPGTSTGGLLTAMLTAPDETNRLLFAAKDVKPGLFGWVGRLLTFLFGPKYDGEYLHKIIREILGKTRLHDALTNVVIPTFDIKNMHPRIFSTYQNQYKQSDVWEFNLIDGGVAANNPSKVENKYNAKKAAKWVLLGWLLNGVSNPIVDVFTQGSADMVDLHISAVFQVLYSKENYLSDVGSIIVLSNKSTSLDSNPPASLRIQDDTLTGITSFFDGATKENLNKLVKIGQRLLKKAVSRVNLYSGLFEPIEKGGTNEDALKKFAKLLSEERRLRKFKSPLNKKCSK
ncbi:patatin-like protein 2 [Olea europaea var. sylvestris]|uniref:patatin-like protein 2 n=1 Tax=Olea europaea var. sylvestris TaxID=158386 RepID=UPI000C1D618C|nr:patatin-like protein 2 [Olea europaea var. sylvestris]